VILLCHAIALHDVDGPIRCSTGERIRLAGIGATELDGSQRRNQPGVPGDGFAQRRIMTRAIGATIAHDDRRLEGYLRFTRPVRLSCNVTGTSFNRLVAWCRLPDGRDASCAAIAAGVALRWPRFDADRRLARCGRK
jgi:endonuclease YncB( thermonuclease family)